MPASYVFAWLLPLIVGAGLCRLARGALRLDGDAAATIGAGWIVGVFIAAIVARWVGSTDTLHASSSAAPWLIAFALLAWAGALLRARRLSRVAPPSLVAASANHAQGAFARVAWWLVLALIVVRVLLLGDEAALRPVFPWDAWSAWAVKPKTWMLIGHAEPYVSMLQWLADPTAAVRTAATWNYPELLAWIEVWFASAAGGWHEPLVDLAWSGALVAYALAAYGYWRGFGLPSWLAMALVYGFVSLPLIDAHVALAGYADLWMAVALGVAVLAWTRWLLHRERGQWWLAMGIALCLPAIKLEGVAWLSTLAFVAALDLVPVRWRWRFVGASIVLALIAIGVMGLGGGAVVVPAFGAFSLQWHPVGGAILASLFSLPNWHLLWYLLPLLIVLRWKVLRHDRVAGLLGVLLALQLGLLFVLFFFTAAAAWAEDFTSANRLILQIVPTVFVFAAALLRDVGVASRVEPAGRGDRPLESPAPIVRA